MNPKQPDQIQHSVSLSAQSAEAQIEAMGETQPPTNVVEDAIRQSTYSPCRSKRGAVVFVGDVVLTAGCNHQVPPLTCDSSLECKARCRRTAIHAEQYALLGTRQQVRGCEMLHVKTVDGRLVPSGPPSCVECSKLMVASGIVGMWLYHVTGWKRYHIEDFHLLSARESQRADAPRPPAAGEMRIPIELEFDFANRVDAFGMAQLPKDREQTPRIVLNMAAILHCAAENTDVAWREITADCALHELLHVFQWALGKALSESEVRSIEDTLAGLRAGEDIPMPEAAAEITVVQSLEAQLDEVRALLDRPRPQTSGRERREMSKQEPETALTALVERLRLFARRVKQPILHEAADALSAQAEEPERLRQAVREVIKALPEVCYAGNTITHIEMSKYALMKKIEEVWK